MASLALLVVSLGVVGDSDETSRPAEMADVDRAQRLESYMPEDDAAS